jgi:hypothetical protein
MTLRKLLLGTAIALAMISPALADDIDRDGGIFIGTAAVYLNNCGSLSPSLIRFSYKMTKASSLVEGWATVSARFNNARIETIGKEAWCAEKKPIIEDAERKLAQ